MAKREKGLIFISIVAFLILAAFVAAANVPTAPVNIDDFNPSTFEPDNYAPQSVEALAGNITAMTIHGIGQTKSWQGYYGNVTAAITLDDADNFTFYNWSSVEPRGEIYATLNNSINWTGVDCFDFSASGGDANWNTIETYYNISTDEVDGVNETYTTTGHPSFQVGSRTMTNCPTTYIFMNDAAQSADFVNVLLYDDAMPATGWIYTAIIEDKDPGVTTDLNCYNGAPCDFQILVNEAGHGTDTATTTYFFWLELE